MRKFTKEISALLAATAMSASVCVATAAESSENIYRTDGVATMSDEEIQPSTVIERTAGEAMPEDMTEPTIAPTTVPAPIGTYVYEEPTEEEFPPTAGVPLPPDETIEPTTLPPVDGGLMPPDETEPTEEIPPLIGEPMPPDETIEPTEEFTEEFPPLAGDIIEPPIETTAPTIPPIGGVTTRHDEETPTILPPTAGETIPSDETIAKPTLRGDADLNGITELADLVTVSKHVLNKSAFPLKNKVAEANADMNGDKTIDVLDVSELTEDQLGK